MKHATGLATSASFGNHDFDIDCFLLNSGQKNMGFLAHAILQQKGVSIIIATRFVLTCVSVLF